MQFQRITPRSVARGEGDVAVNIRQLARGIGAIGQGVVPICSLFPDYPATIEEEGGVASRFGCKRTATIHHVISNDTRRVHAQALTESVIVHLSLRTPTCAIVRFHLYEVTCSIIGITFCTVPGFPFGRTSVRLPLAS